MVSKGDKLVTTNIEGVKKLCCIHELDETITGIDFTVKEVYPDNKGAYLQVTDCSEPKCIGIEVEVCGKCLEALTSISVVHKTGIQEIVDRLDDIGVEVYEIHEGYWCMGNDTETTFTEQQIRVVADMLLSM